VQTLTNNTTHNMHCSGTNKAVM